MKYFSKTLLAIAFFAVGFAGAWAIVDAGQLAFNPSAVTAHACGSGSGDFQCSCTLPPTCRLWTDPTSRDSAGDVVLYWDSTNSIGGSISPAVGTLLGAGGHVTVYIPIGDTTFTGTFWNSLNQQIQCTAKVTVTPPQPSVSCAVSPPSGTTSTTFNWTATASGGTPGYTYAWSGTNLTGKSGSAVSTTYSTAGTYPGSVTVTDSAGQTASANCIPVVVTTPPPQNGCIIVHKEAYDTNGNPLSDVPQFSFTLDGGSTRSNDASGIVEFDNVTPGDHTVAESSASGWTSITAASQPVHVDPGTPCAALYFKNEQVLPPPTDLCPNIAGVQTSVPAGMVIDSNGNCVTPPPSCQNLTPTGSVIAGNATLVVAANSCPVEVSFSSYDLPNGTQLPFSSQVLHDNITATYGPGTHHIGPLKLTCNWQTDLYLGPVQTVLNDAYGNSNLIAADSLTGQNCTPPPSAPSCTLTANPNSFSAPGTTTLSWTTTGTVTSTTIDHNIGSVTTVASTGSLPNVPVSASTTFIMTVIGPGGTATCQAPVTITTPGPACTLTVSASTINTGDSVVLSWTSSNVSSGSIDNNIGNASPVSSGSVTVYPPSSTTFHGTFTGPGGTVSCSVPLTVNAGGCGSGGCGGGGLNQPNVALYQQPNQQPLAFVSLSQIPYTGFEAGPALTMIFWLAIAALSALIAYAIVGRGAMRYALAYVLGTASGLPIQEGDVGGENMQNAYGRAYPAFDEDVAGDASMATSASVMAAPAPTAFFPAAVQAPAAPLARAPKAAVPEIVSTIESRAHAAGVLVSPEAVAQAAALSGDRSEALRVFGMILDEATHTIPREDGWIMLTADKLRELSAKYPAMAASALAPIDTSAAGAFAGAVAGGDRESAFSIVRQLEHEGTKPTALMTATATAFDQFYRARHSNQPAPDLVIADKASRLSDAQLERLVAVFTHALDHVYASPFTGVKLALAQAFEVIG